MKNIKCLTVLMFLFIFSMGTAACGKKYCDYFGSLETPCQKVFTCTKCGKEQHITQADFSYATNEGVGHYHIVYCGFCGAGPYKVPVAYSYPSMREYVKRKEGYSPYTCAIATAAFESPFCREVEILRKFRDSYLLTNSIGRSFVNFYYKISPPIARFIAKSHTRRAFVRILLFPVVKIAKLLIKK